MQSTGRRKRDKSSLQKSTSFVLPLVQPGSSPMAVSHASMGFVFCDAGGPLTVTGGAQNPPVTIMTMVHYGEMARF